jgi:hypothetical protein
MLGWIFMEDGETTYGSVPHYACKSVSVLRPTLCVQVSVALSTSAYGFPMPQGQGDLATAVTEGLTDEATITASTRRTLMQKMKVGLFDAPEDSPWAKLGADALNSTHAQQVAYEAALQGMVRPARVGSIQTIGVDDCGLLGRYC